MIPPDGDHGEVPKEEMDGPPPATYTIKGVTYVRIADKWYHRADDLHSLLAANGNYGWEYGFYYDWNHQNEYYFEF